MWIWQLAMHVLLFVGVARQTIILCYRVVCSLIYLIIFFMDFNLLLYYFCFGL